VKIYSVSSHRLPQAETDLVYLNCDNNNLKSPVVFLLSRNMFIFQSIDGYNMNKRKGGIDFYLTKTEEIE
jgi:hypothetical protein